VRADSDDPEPDWIAELQTLVRFEKIVKSSKRDVKVGEISILQKLV